MTNGLAVWVLYPLFWMRHLSGRASQIREGGERKGRKWDFIERFVSVENAGKAQKQRPHNGEIQSNILESDSFNLSSSSYGSPSIWKASLQLKRFLRKYWAGGKIKSTSNQSSIKPSNVSQFSVSFLIVWNIINQKYFHHSCKANCLQQNSHFYSLYGDIKPVFLAEYHTIVLTGWDVM